jgi:CRISPR system Cascade subunit CasE
MYFSRMPLNPQRRSTKDLIASPQRMHAAVLAGFLPGASARGRVLWRLDADSQHELNLLVISPEPPSFEALVEQAGWSANPVWQTVDYTGFLDKLSQEQRWVFRLVANPVRSVRPAGTGLGPKGRGARVPLVRESDQIDWLVKRGAQHGFSVVAGASAGPNLKVTGSRRVRFGRNSDGETRTVTLQAAQFDGVMEVTDPVDLRKALTAGIGSGKGYGCGLLTLARL